MRKGKGEREPVASEDLNRHGLIERGDLNLREQNSRLSGVSVLDAIKLEVALAGGVRGDGSCEEEWKRAIRKR